MDNNTINFNSQAFHVCLEVLCQGAKVNNQNFAEIVVLPEIKAGMIQNFQ